QDVTDQADEDSIPFPSLAPGDVIDVSYRVEDYQRGDLAGQFWNEWFIDATEKPVKVSRFVLITPTGMSYKTQEHGAVPQPTTKTLGKWTIHEWREANVPMVSTETLGTTRVDCGSWLDISTVPSWSTIVHWYRGLSGPLCVPDATIRAKAAELTKNATTEDDKMHAIVAYVRQLRYQSTPFRLSAYIPTEGKQVIREGYGDCKDKAALLTSLLAAVGIQAHMALLSPRSHGITPYLPSPRFNHAIACVDTSHGPVWVDATADQMQYGDLPSGDQQVPALLIDDSTTDLTAIPVLPVDSTKVQQAYTGSLSEDGDLHDSLSWTCTGDMAWIMRTAFKQVPKDKDDEALRQIATEFSSTAVYDTGSLGGLDDPDSPFTMQIQYHIDHFGAVAGGFLLAKLPWAHDDESALEAALADPKRSQDVEVAEARGDYVTTLDLTMPAGYTPQDLQPDVSQDSPWGSFHMTYSVQGNVLHAVREYKLTALRVPLADVPKFLAFIKALNDETNKQVVYKKG
ncbi:MAG TPA: DUF3857 domain-containing protein, partial [Capsulimonadaceae bacterium]|nr:DUF3857 domain-containing protein [Capsulimonadaceae bacterium]